MGLLKICTEFNMTENFNTPCSLVQNLTLHTGVWDLNLDINGAFPTIFVDKPEELVWRLQAFSLDFIIVIC